MSDRRRKGCIASDKEVSATLDLEFFGRLAFALIAKVTDKSVVNVTEIAADDSDSAHTGFKRERGGEGGRKWRRRIRSRSLKVIAQIWSR